MPSMHLSDDKVNALGEERSCSICNTTKTPLWRGGPCGPKSLCNACGIKYRKKRRDSLGLEGGVKKERSKKDQESNKVVSSEKKSKSSSASNKDPLIKMKMAGLEGECVINKKRRVFMQLGEEERAAILLMTLSAGFVHG